MIDQEPDLSAFSSGLAFGRLLLDEGAVGLRPRPFHLFDPPVDCRTLTVGQEADGELRHVLILGRRDGRGDEHEHPDPQHGQSSHRYSAQARGEYTVLAPGP